MNPETPGQEPLKQPRPDQNTDLPEPIPARPSPWQLLTAFHSSAPRWPGALRAALAVTLPGLLALMLGFENEIMLIAAGGFAVIYGEGHAYRARWRVMLIAGALIALSATAGAFVGESMFQAMGVDGSHWWLLLSAFYTIIIATIGTFVQNALRLPPPGSFFIVMVGGGSTMVAKLGLNPVDVGLWAMVGVAAALLIGMFPALFNHRHPQEQAVKTLEQAVADFEAAEKPALAKNHQAETALTNAWGALSDSGAVRAGQLLDEKQRDLVDRVTTAHRRLSQASAMLPQGGATEELTDTPNYIDLSRTAIPMARPSVSYRIYRSLHPDSHASITAIKVAVATTLAAVIGIALGFDRPDWAVVSALLMIQWGPDRIPGTIRGLHRMIGSLIGIFLFALFHYLEVEGFTLLLALAVCQFGAEFFVTRNYAFTVIFTTPLALLMGDSLASPLGEVMFGRSMEILLSIVFGLLALWFILRDSGPRHHDRLVRRAFDAMGAATGALLTSRPGRQLTELRDLQYELLGERRAVQTLVNNHPEIAKERWNTHLAVQLAGYSLLDYVTASANRQLSFEEIAELARRIRTAREYN
ncbi:Fusaric acid resistance protein family protein [Corynebacterium occultum]|uniref:Fusaric acid resistance protein family protein n=1 Tax=Corynebacterium occultum TaxID=2675219 RepID=A0A6B8VY67_9CORY|nr:FUSC family protein [Corynebacterium occultum]QGU07989.1 Fusaric acid resistance protein family protein [Corynebacterium occultum]